MKTQLLVTMVGEDRPGLVARLTEVLVKHGGNLEESRMAILGGEFAAIMLVTVSESGIPALQEALLLLKDEAITVTTKRTASTDRSKDVSIYELVLRGADHEGIVHGVTACLRDKSVNIQAMETEVVHAPETATPLFNMKATLQVPGSVKESELKDKLNEIARREAVDIKLLPRAVPVG